MKFNQYIDHTLLKPTATPEEIAQLCREAIQHKFYGVCINPCFIELAKKELKTKEVKIVAVIGFPLGAMTTAAKVFEAKDAISRGADEIDMVINIGMLKANHIQYVENEISKVKKAIGVNLLKVIIETCFLTDLEKEAICLAALSAQADFVKTSTGFGTAGATFKDVKLMKKIVGDKMSIKASGGIKDKETAAKYIDMGVSRLGTSSGIKLGTSEEKQL